MRAEKPLCDGSYIFAFKAVPTFNRSKGHEWNICFDEE